MDFILGADPEVFLCETNNQKEVVSAIGLIPGTKQKPFPMVGGSMHPDNVTLEFQMQPAKGRKNFIDNMETIMEDIKKHLNQYELSYKISPEAKFNLDSLVDPRAQEFGCAPDENLYFFEASETYLISSGTYRTAGGHIHIGANLGSPWTFIRALDITLGLLDYLHDEDLLRKKTYGRLGTFRLKPYGVEYRTPSNWWLKNKATMGLLYSAVEEAFVLKEKGVPDQNFAASIPTPEYAANILQSNVSPKYFSLIQGVLEC